MRNAVPVAAMVAALLVGPAPLPADAPASLPTAAAAACPQVEVIFARGRQEPPGVGRIGEAFFAALRARTDKSLDSYPVNYVADLDVAQGANDMSRRIQYMANNCPATRLVLGGYSLGAAAIDVLMGAPSPLFGYTDILPLGMSDHVAAVALFGNGTRKVLGPVADVSPLWGDKTIDICTPDDPICNDSLDPNNWVDNWNSHLQDAYIGSGLIDQAADFAAARL